MNILIIQGGVNKNLPSGEMTIIKNESEYLSRNHEVNVVYFEIKKGILSKVSSLFWSFENYNKTLKLIEEYKPDIVHFHTIIPYLSLSVLYAAKKKNIPVVQTLHNGRWLCVEGGYFKDDKYCEECVGTYGINGVKSRCSQKSIIVSFFLFIINFYVRLSGTLFRLVNKFIAVSDFVKEKHIKSGFPDNKIVVKNNGLNLADINKIYERNKSFERKGIAFAGRVSVAKGSNIMKYLIPRVNENIYIIGTGPELENLKSFCAENSFTHVKFMGKLSNKQTLSILSSVICTIVPSNCGDSFPTVAIESMAMATPVIASEVGGLTMLLKDSQGGIIVPLYDVDGFYNKTIELLNNKSESMKIGLLGQRYIFTQLSNDTKGDELIKIYEDVIKK